MSQQKIRYLRSQLLTRSREREAQAESIGARIAVTQSRTLSSPYAGGRLNSLMSQFTELLRTSPPLSGALDADQCNSVLARTCFGHLGFALKAHVEAVPIRFAFVEGSLYFRANRAMCLAIASNRWVLISVVEMVDATHFASVVARGTCYETEHTGTTNGDAAALRGIVELRDRAPASPRVARGERKSIVFRVHVDDLRGRTTFVPCPAAPSHAFKSRRPQVARTPLESAGSASALENR
jgi:nitroimidazol reductase NimA-like FMN-containing flavoprotein (pyridoxamine 5'-phosphate oxidase superfamily)